MTFRPPAWLSGFALGLVVSVALGLGVSLSACSSGNCGPIALYAGEYKVEFSRQFNEQPAMEKGTLIYEPELARVTISYDSSSGPATVVLRAQAPEGGH